MKGLVRICGMRGWKKEVGDGTRPTPTNYASQKTVLSNLCCVYLSTCPKQKGVKDFFEL